MINPEIVVGDENSFILFVENAVYRLQELWREKEGMDSIAVLDTCEKLEDVIYKKALKENHPVPLGNLFLKYSCDLWFTSLLFRLRVAQRRSHTLVPRCLAKASFKVIIFCRSGWYQFKCTSLWTKLEKDVRWKLRKCSTFVEFIVAWRLWRWTKRKATLSK